MRKTKTRYKPSVRPPSLESRYCDCCGQHQQQTISEHVNAHGDRWEVWVCHGCDVMQQFKIA